MKTCWLSYIIKWNFHPYTHHWQSLAPIVEHYSQHLLLLQRDVLTLCCGEAKARHNSLQAFYKKFLARCLAPKIPYYELWGSIYKKGWGDPWHSPLTLWLHWWLFTLHIDYSHSTDDNWNFIYNIFKNNNTISTYTHVGQNRLESTKQDTSSLGVLGRYQLGNILLMVFGDELVPSVVLHYCVPVWNRLLPPWILGMWFCWSPKNRVNNKGDTRPVRTLSVVGPLMYCCICA